MLPTTTIPSAELIHCLNAIHVRIIPKPHTPDQKPPESSDPNISESDISCSEISINPSNCERAMGTQLFIFFGLVAYK